jgi:hypothetical protein
MQARGLTEAEAARLLSARPHPEHATSRSYASIVRANVFTIFNLILAVAGTATLVFGEWQDALFLGVLVSNSAIGITQEVRAKRALIGSPRSWSREQRSSATVPIDLARLIRSNFPIRHATYELREVGHPTLDDVLAAVIARVRSGLVPA